MVPKQYRVRRETYSTKTTDESPGKQNAAQFDSYGIKCCVTAQYHIYAVCAYFFPCFQNFMINTSNRETPKKKYTVVSKVGYWKEKGQG